MTYLGQGTRTTVARVSDRARGTPVRRLLGGLGLAAALLLGTASPAGADTFQQPPVDTLSAGAAWVNVVGGVEHFWFASATIDRVTGQKIVSASYSASYPITCNQGPGQVDVVFDGSAEGVVHIRSDLSAAVAAAIVRGTEATFRSCGDEFSERFRSRHLIVGIALRANGAPESFPNQGCVDFDDGNGPILVTSNSTSRTAQGAVSINGRSSRVEGGISHDTATNDGPCAP
jgi:hypothetical protein